jgi:hypothetical protein
MVETATCGRCGHTEHTGDDPERLGCVWPGCDCQIWVLARCPGSQGRVLSGQCPGAPFIGGHDTVCPDFEKATEMAPRDRLRSRRGPPRVDE